VHDLFDILGLPSSAPPLEVRRVCARRVRRSHPDFQVAGVPPPPEGASDPAPPVRDVAVDFLEVHALLDRVQAAFFREA
jgi:hypothetical protein